MVKSAFGTLEVPREFVDRLQRFIKDMYVGDPPEVYQNVLFFGCWNELCEIHEGWWSVRRID